MSSSTTPAVRTRTGRRVVPTPAALAAAADKAAALLDKEKEKESKVTTPTTNTTPTSRAGGRGPGRIAKADKDGAKEKSPVKETVASKSASVSSSPSVAAGKDKDMKDETTPTAGGSKGPPDSPRKRGGLRSKQARISTSSADEEIVTKKAKLAEPEQKVVEKQEPEEIIVHEREVEEETEAIAETEQMETQEITDDSQIFEAVAKMNAETEAINNQAAASIASSSSAVTTTTIIVADDQQRNAVDSILGENATVVTVQGDMQTVEFVEGDVTATVVNVETNPPWNEQGCLICNVDIPLDDPTTSTPKSDQLKDFFLEFFSVGDQISLDDETTFPFCSKCAEEMEGLLTVSQNIESMHKQFNKVRDSMARKAIKTFLTRTKPNFLEEDAKAENYGFLDEDQKKSYKDQMFSLWKSRYELVQPGPKTPVMIRSMDSRGRVTVVRLNSHGQAVPEKFGGVRIREGAPLGGTGGRFLTNGGDDDEGGSGMGGTLDVYQCKDCSKVFSAKSMLDIHSKVHSGELPYACDQCHRAFSVPHYLMTHMKSHSGEKPYKCSECGKGFAQRGGLVTHSLVHTGAKPYSCQICGKSFRQKYHLTQHNLIHSGVKPFSCELCGKCFNVKMNLREHMRRHTGDRPYKCPYCTTVGFFRKKMLKEHIVKGHPQRPMPEELMGAEASTSYAAGNSEDTTIQEEEDLEEEFEEDEEMVPEAEDDSNDAIGKSEVKA